MAVKIIFEDEKDAYAFLELCRLIAKVLDEIKFNAPEELSRIGKSHNLRIIAII